MDPWVDSKDWRDTWEEVEKIPGGGQGQGRLVKSRNTSEFSFLKTLRRQDDPERRARFFREATAYSTCSHRGLPQLIQTNAHKHLLSDYKLFIATEFIVGSTLSRIIDVRGPSSLEDALKTTQSLLEVIDYYHRANWVHRDIKPDNVILRSDDADAPVLVDFGLGFRDDPDEAFRTEHGQELGNRFLRLPELSVNSPVKQDARSDLACLAGILVFLLTGHSPAVLVDATGKLPHQRSEILAGLKKAGSHRLIRLLTFFDKAFQQKIADRYGSANEMRLALLKIHENKPAMKEEDADAQLTEILSGFDTKRNEQLAELQSICEKGMNAIKEVQQELLLKTKTTFHGTSGNNVRSVNGKSGDLGFAYFADYSKRFAPRFEIRLIGDELIVQVDGETIHRTSIEFPKFDTEFKDKIKKIFVDGLRELTISLNR